MQGMESDFKKCVLHNVTLLLRRACVCRDILPAAECSEQRLAQQQQRVRLLGLVVQCTFTVAAAAGAPAAVPAAVEAAAEGSVIRPSYTLTGRSSSRTSSRGLGYEV